MDKHTLNNIYVDYAKGELGKVLSDSLARSHHDIVGARVSDDLRTTQIEFQHKSMGEMLDGICFILDAIWFIRGNYIYIVSKYFIHESMKASE